MIELDVKDYCHGCKEFDPDYKMVILYGDYEEKDVCQTITCKKRVECERIYYYLKNKEGVEK